ncbi:hypothetical protein DN752_23055 [Echinicola strongylocentroti]|uniref:Carbohydrate-binding protein n=1 Tax=Echinicola strongylocentroti TaxID=1795355 RepID=A0A2Z4IQ05_9BACT|nr:carbohydrate-binding protein [Echinicola strongylocentroti]AWW32789.1 hypothetical protein DN752_23055 [Echinicola strongylocentroti]
MKTDFYLRGGSKLRYLFCMKMFLVAWLWSVCGMAQTTVASLAELKPYLKQDNVDVKMTPGVYTITAEDVANGLFDDETTISGVTVKALLLFEGSNSTYDFSDVTIQVETAVFQAYGNVQVYEVQVIGNENVLKNLTLEDVGSVHDRPTRGALNICMDGRANRIEGFHVTAKGSYPYGYGDAFGKGGSYTIKHYKHSACLIRGESNHLKNSTFIHRSYGHCIFMQAASNPLIEGCLVEGEVRSTDDMLAETSGPAYDIDFMTDWGYRLPAGYMLSTGEAGIRAYNGGQTVIDGVEYSRGTSNPTVLNCTIKYMRTGVTIAHATGTKYVEGCTAIGCENGFSLGSGDVVDCAADCTYGPVYASTYENDRNYNADITILPASDPYYNGSGSVAYIGGSGHQITLKGSSEALEQGYKIKVGGDKNNIRLLNGNLPHQNDFAASDFELNNHTNIPVFLSSKSSGIVGQSGGMVTDLGTNNNLVHTAVPVLDIEAEDYTDMSGVTTETTTDNNGGENITSVEGDDWLEYQIDVPYSGTYFMDYRVASASVTGDFVVLAEEDTLENITFPATGGGQTWSTTRSPAAFYLSKGTHTLKVHANSPGWNLNWMQLLLECAETPIVPFGEESNSLGMSIRREQTASWTVFPGNTISLQPEPLLGGSWTWAGPNGFTANSRVVDIQNIDVDDAGAYVATYTNDCGQSTSVEFTVVVQNALEIEAEDYSDMSGVETEDTDDTTGTENVTAIDAGDWMEYSVEVAVSGTYSVDYRLSSEDEGDFTLSINGEEKETVDFTATEGTPPWETIAGITSYYLEEGTHTFRITANTPGWKINWVKLNSEQFVNPCELPFSPEGFSIKNETVEWSSGLIDIGCAATVNAYVELSEAGSLGSEDHINLYYRLDGSEKVAILENSGSLAEAAGIVRELDGETLELIIEGSSASATDFYTINKINIVESSDPFARIEAEDFTEADGPRAGNTGDVGGGQNLGSIVPGAWSMYADLDLTDVKSIDARVASIYDDSYVEVRINAVDGPLIGTLEVPQTGDWQTYETVSAYIEDVVGIYDVYLVYQSGSSHVCNINWFEFSDAFVAPPIDPYERFEAENYDGQEGTDTVATSDMDGDQELGDLQDGDWVRYDGLDFSDASTLTLRLASDSEGSGTVELRLDAVNGPIISILDVPDTGSLGDWQTVATQIDRVEEEHDIFLVFKGEGDDLLRLNWLQFDIYENPNERIEAEDFDDQFGDPNVAGTTSDVDGGMDLRGIFPGDWIMFTDIDLTGAKSITARIGSLYDDAYIEIRDASVDGPVIGNIPLHNTGGWHSWETVTGSIEELQGLHDLYFIFKTESSPNVCNINWFQLSGLKVDAVIDPFARIEAEDYSGEKGTAIATTTDSDGEEEVEGLDQGDWIKFNQVSMDDVGRIDVRVASTCDDCHIQLRSGAYDGPLLAEMDIPNTGATNSWETINAPVTSSEGIHHLYLVFQGGQDMAVKVNWLQFFEFEIPAGYLEAEDHDDMYGIQTQETSDESGGENVGWVHNDDWIMFSEVDLTDISMVDARYSSPNTGCGLEVRLGAVDGPLVSYIDQPSTGDWDNWQTASANVLDTEGVHDVYIIFKGGGGYLSNLNWLYFKEGERVFERVEIEDFTTISSGPRVASSTSDVDGGADIRSVKPGNWTYYENLDLTSAKSLTVRSGTQVPDARVEIRLDDPNGTLVGEVPLINSGGWHNWVNSSANIEGAEGVQDVYLVYQTDSSANVGNFNWFEFSSTTLQQDVDPLARIEAENYDLVKGTSVETTTDTDGVKELMGNDGDWIAFGNLDLSEIGRLDLRVASNQDGGTIEVRSADYLGELLATIEVPGTDSFTGWETIKGEISDIADKQHIFLVFKANSEQPIKVNWLQFKPKPIDIGENSKVEAEKYYEQVGVETQITTDETGHEHVGMIDNGDHISFDVNVLQSGIYKVSFRVSSESTGGEIAMRTDGDHLGTTAVPVTGSKESWKTVEALIKLNAGKQVLAFEFLGDGEDLFDLNWILFELSGIDLSLQTRTKGKVSDNSIQTDFELLNQGNESLSLDSLTIRYWFTAEDAAPLSFNVDYAELGGENITGKFHSSAPVRKGGYTFLEMDFQSGIDLIGGMSTGDIQTRIAKNDWTDFSEDDDHSFIASSSYVENQKVTLYYNGNLIWGTVPEIEPAETALEVYHKAGDFNSPADNQLKPQFKLENTGNTPVALADIKVRYWFSEEDEAPVNFYLDWAEMGGQGIDGAIYENESEGIGANKYLELTFTGNDTLHSLSGTGEIRTRLAKTNWSDFEETDDHSYVSTKTYESNEKITVYIKEELVWGYEPMGSESAREYPTEAASKEGEVILTEVQLYPNPASEKLTVDYAVPQKGLVVLKVLDITGKVLHNEMNEVDAGRHTTELSVSDLSSGVYILQLKQFGNQSALKFIVKH